MTVESIVVISSQRVPDTPGAMYTSTNRKTIVDMCTITNTTASPATVDIWVVPASGSQDDTNLIVKNKSIAAAECWLAEGIIGRRLGIGEQLVLEAGTANALTIRAEGRGIT